MENSSGIKIPENLLNKFKGQRVDPPDPGGDGAAPGTYSGDLEILESLNDTLSWICKTGDNIAKQNGFPGLGDVPPDQLGELLTIIAKRNLPGSIIEKSPEAAGLAIFGGIAAQNYIAWQRKQKQQPQQNENKEEKSPENE